MRSARAAVSGFCIRNKTQRSWGEDNQGVRWIGSDKLIVLVDSQRRSSGLHKVVWNWQIKSCYKWISGKSLQKDKWNC